MLLPRQEELAATSSAEESGSATWSDITPVESCCEHWVPDTASHDSKHSRRKSMLKSPNRPEGDVAEKQPAESRSGTSPGQIMQEVSRNAQHPSSAVSPKSSSSSHHSKHSRPTSTMASPRRSKTDVAEKRSVESNSGQIMQEVSNDIPYPPMSPKVSSSSHESTHSRPTSASKSSHRSKDNVAETQSVESVSGASPGQIMQEISRDAQHPSSAVSPKSSSSSHQSKHSRPTSKLASPHISKDDVAETRSVESSSGQIMQDVSNDIPYPTVSPKVSYSTHGSRHSRPTSTSSHRSKDNVEEKRSVESNSGAWQGQIMQEVSRDARHPSSAVSPKSSSSSHQSKHSRPTSKLASPHISKDDVAETRSVESSSGQIMQDVSNDIPYPTVSPTVSSSSHGSTHSRPTSQLTSPRRSKTDASEKQPAESISGASPGQIMQEVSRDAQHPSSAVSLKSSSSSHHSQNSRPSSKLTSPLSSKTDASEKQPAESRSGSSPGQIMKEVSRDAQHPSSAVSLKSSSSSHHSKHSRPSSTVASPRSSKGQVAEKRSVESNSGQIRQEVSNYMPYPAMSPKVSFSSHGSTHSRPTSHLTSPRRSKADAAEKQSVECISGASPGHIMQEVSSDIQYPGDAVSPKLSSSSNDPMRFGPTSTLKSPHRSKGKVAEKQSVESRPGAMQEVSLDMQYPSAAAAPKSSSSSQESNHSRTRSTLASPRRSKADVDEKKSVDTTSGAWPGQIMQEVSNEMHYPSDALSPKSTSLSHAAVYSSPTSRHSSLCTATGDDGDVQPTMERLSGTWPGQMVTQEDSRGDSRSELSSASPGPPHSRQTSLLSSPIMSSSDVQRAIGVLEHSQKDGDVDFADDSKDATSELKMTESNCAPLERLSPRLSSANSITNSDEEKTNVSERERDNEVLVPMRSELLGSTAVESTNEASHSQDETPSSNEQGGSEEQCPDDEGLTTHVAPDLKEQGDVDIDCKTNSHEAIPDMTENERNGSGCEERSSTVNSNVESPYQQDSGESDYDSRPSSVNASDVECLKERRRKPSSCDKWRQSARRSSAMPRRGTIDVNEGERLSVASPDLQPSSPFFVRSRSSLKSAISGTGFREPNDDTEDVIRERTEAPSTDCVSAVEIRPRDADEEVGVGGSEDGGIAEGESDEPESRAQSDDGVEDVNHEGSLTVVPTSDEYPEVPWVCVAE